MRRVHERARTLHPEEENLGPRQSCLELSSVQPEVQLRKWTSCLHWQQKPKTETFQGPSDSTRSGVPSQDGAISPQRQERVPTAGKELHTDLERQKVVWFEIHDPTQGSKDRHRRLVEDSRGPAGHGFAWLLSLISRPS